MKRRSLSNQLRYACSKQNKFGISRRMQKYQGVNTKENIYSIQSMKKMKTMARQLGDFVRTNHPDIHYVYEIKPDVVREFVHKKKVTGDWSSKATQVEKLSQLRKLESVCKAAFPGSQINFMEGIDNGIFERDGKAPVRDIYMTQHDYKALEDKCLRSRSKARFAPLLTFRIGGRLQEISSITPNDIDLENRLVHLTNCKGGRNRTVPIEDIKFFTDLKKMCLEEGWPTVCGGLRPSSVSKFISRSLAVLYQEGKVSIDYSAHKTGNHAIRKLYARNLLAKFLNVSEQELSTISKKELLQAWPKVQTILGHGPVGRVQLFRVYIGNYV